MAARIILSTLLCLFLLINGFSCEDVVVSIDQGDLIGVRNQVTDDLYVDFFGRIPFAAAPVGDLRFRPPGPAPSWAYDGQRDATYYGPGCPQLGSLISKIRDLLPDLPDLPFLPEDIDAPELPDIPPIGEIIDFLSNLPLEEIIGTIRNLTFSDFLNEDCLYMNIYAPEYISAPDATFPVMVFIQGGAYSVGTAMALYDGSILAERQQVIVVTFNYRLGALGYLSTMDDVSPGNYGMLDQVAALKWVKYNIAAFGGDPDDVTIFGESAGAASVSMHMLSPMSQGLFKKVIAESGSALNSWAVYVEPYDATDAAYLLADNIGCPRQPHEDLVDCLRTMDPFLISAMTPILLYDIFTWAPVVDGPDGFLPDKPMNLIKNGQFNKDIPVLIGYNKNETSPLMLFVDGADDGITRDEFNQLIWDRNVVGKKYYTDTNIHYGDLFKAYANQYTPWEDPDNELLLRDAYMEFLDELIFHGGIHWQARSFAMYGLDTYVYRFDYDRPGGIFADWMGVPHTTELFYVFGASFQDNAFDFMAWTDDDRNVSDTVQTLWCNFAKTGNPTPNGVTVPNVEGYWEKFTRDNQRMFHINYISTMLNDTIDHDDNAFWMEYEPEVVKSASRQDVCECPTTEPCDNLNTSQGIVTSYCIVLMLTSMLMSIHIVLEFA